MTRPTTDQTEGVWIGRTNDDGYYYVQEVFSGKNSVEQFHQSNCRRLITRGSLIPEGYDGLEPAQRDWVTTRRYCRVHR